MQLDIDDAPGRRKQRSESSRGDPSQVETTESWTPPKCGGQGQLDAILGLENEVFKLGERPLDCVKPFQKRSCYGEADRADTAMMLQRSHDVDLILWGRRIECWRSPVFHDDRKRRPAL